MNIVIVFSLCTVNFQSSYVIYRYFMSKNYVSTSKICVEYWLIEYAKEHEHGKTLKSERVYNGKTEMHFVFKDAFGRESNNIYIDWDKKRHLTKRIYKKRLIMKVLKYGLNCTMRKTLITILFWKSHIFYMMNMLRNNAVYKNYTEYQE